MSEDFVALQAHLIEETRRCVNAPVGRFRWPWLAPMAGLPTRRGVSQGASAPGAASSGDGWGDDDRFALGDYGGGLFHHDVSESAIELCRYPDLAEACFGSLLCFLDGQTPSGRIHRIELPFRTRDPEPSKPVMAQLALRAIGGVEDGLVRADRERVLPRLLGFIGDLEATTTGMHGLLITPSARASGFDSDVLTAGLPDGVVEGPDTSTFMVLEYEAAATLAERLAEDGIARGLREKAARLRERIDLLLWYPPEGTYVGLRWRQGSVDRRDEVVGHRDPDGVFRPLATWIGLLPLYAGIPSPARAEASIARLLDPQKYWGPSGVRTVPRDDVYFHQAPRVMVHDPRKHDRGPVSNWSGPVWVLSNYYMFRALERYGHRAEAEALARTTARVLAEDLRETGGLHECYDDRGSGLWPRRGTFISWNVLALTMLREIGALETGPRAVVNPAT